MRTAGTDMPAMSAIPTGAPTIVPSCHNSFFFLNQEYHGLSSLQATVFNLLSTAAFAVPIKKIYKKISKPAPY
jgi:uncharacterized protein YraI